jgi:DNA uptake protein ComE-like DNA-binding protein
MVILKPLEALKDVQGIGEALLARNADKIALQ